MNIGYIKMDVDEIVSMTRAEYNDYRGWTLPENENGSDIGFLIKYSNDHITWLPKNACIFIHKDKFTFEDALTAIKEGKKVARKGWNGKNMFVYMIPANRYTSCTEIANSIADEDGKVNYANYLGLYNANTNIVNTWVPSISDLFAEDWYVVE